MLRVDQRRLMGAVRRSVGVGADEAHAKPSRLPLTADVLAALILAGYVHTSGLMHCKVS